MNNKPSQYYNQAAAIPYRITDNGVEILLITTQKGKRWIVPKGIIEGGLTAEASALKEAYEEAGIMGEISGPPLGSFQYDKWGGTLNVVVFPMKVTEILPDWQESHFRIREWVRIDEAGKNIGFEDIIPLFDELRKRLLKDR